MAPYPTGRLTECTYQQSENAIVACPCTTLIKMILFLVNFNPSNVTMRRSEIIGVNNNFDYLVLENLIISLLNRFELLTSASRRLRPFFRY
jgi:hypothetical protein